MKHQRIILAVGIFVLMLFCGGCEANKENMDDWTTVLIEEDSTALDITLPPELSETLEKIEVEGERNIYKYRYHTDYSNFEIYISSIENIQNLSEEVMRALIGSDIQYISENIFDEMRIGQPESEDGERTIHDAKWIYSSLFGTSQKNSGGTVKACEYVHMRNTDFIEVIIMYAVGNEAPRREASMLAEWFDIIPGTIELQSQTK